MSGIEHRLGRHPGRVEIAGRDLRLRDRCARGGDRPAIEHPGGQGQSLLRRAGRHMSLCNCHERIGVEDLHVTAVFERRFEEDVPDAPGGTHRSLHVPSPRASNANVVHRQHTEIGVLDAPDASHGDESTVVVAGARLCPRDRGQRPSATPWFRRPPTPMTLHGTR